MMAQIISHPNYNSNTMNNDIALIRLEDPINFNNNTQPVVLMCDQQVALGVEDPDKCHGLQAGEIPKEQQTHHNYKL